MKFPLPLLCAILIALIGGPSAARESAPVASTSDAYVRHLAGLINDYRQRHGLAPLSIAGELAALAGEHSESMSGQRRLSHEGFGSRLQRAGSRLCVENVGRGYPTAETQLDGWRHSPSHHVNLLEPAVSRMGIAASARYVTFFACR